MDPPCSSRKRLTPELTAALPFTRYLIGPADYTPGGSNNVLPRQFKPVNKPEDGERAKNTTPEIGTRVHALALCVAYDSPLMTLCDTPGVYRGRKGLEALRNLPAVWADTECTGGEIGAWYGVVRKAFDGRIYYAAITAGKRRVKQDLSFLGGGDWKMTLYSDDPSVNENDAKAIRIETRSVTVADTLDIPLAPAGGALAVDTSK